MPYGLVNRSATFTSSASARPTSASARGAGALSAHALIVIDWTSTRRASSARVMPRFAIHSFRYNLSAFGIPPCNAVTVALQEKRHGRNLLLTARR